ncbi:peptidylprolyl isomerase [Pseudoroseomonas ludipueritiae]|uniref:Parvulin-like PPIase n=1 Tax=Pseudoroseomonas ludipueritiae TaxID=198093 RepID=A0ABR7R6D7_9PROT|nr:peptidylprolyl isomerase [Pseudoroseomonas ludipueritiae]MBC9177295.1 peptidylprolyl isomerase [Pseudoroseomonas ludipueritiae]
MRSSALILPLLLAAAQPALAQGTPPAPATQPPAAAAPAQPTAEDPLLARVDGQEIRRSDVQAAIAELPPELRSAPESVLSPLVIDQMITQKALVAAARAQKLQDQPEVQARLKRAEEQELQQALLRQEISPKLTDEALRARYARDIAGKPGEEEVHARHILVANEADAKKVEAEVRKPGADFAAIARSRSTGPGTEQGGDLGFFKKGDMVPEFAEAAFAMKPGEISQPVRSPFGWHVIKVEARRTAEAPSYEDSLETLRQAAFDETVQDTVNRIRASAKVERFNEDGTPRAAEKPAPSLLDGATPPPAQRR